MLYLVFLCRRHKSSELAFWSQDCMTPSLDLTLTSLVSSNKIFILIFILIFKFQFSFNFQISIFVSISKFQFSFQFPYSIYIDKRLSLPLVIMQQHLLSCLTQLLVVAISDVCSFESKTEIISWPTIILRFRFTFLSFDTEH
jgi:hypothetical protein